MIELSGLVKRFGSVRALDGVSMKIDAGSTVAILGANGSGKSTLLKVVAGLLRPTQGTVRLAGGSPREMRGRIGYLGHGPHLYPYLTVAENLRFYARLYRIDLSRAEDLMSVVGVEAKAGALVRTLSRGETQRLALARCLLHDPDYLVLDEPLTGLDTDGREAFPGLVGRPGRTILLSSHDRDATQSLADRSFTLAHGRMQGP